MTQNVYKASHNVNGPPAKLWARARQPSGPDGILPAETPFGLLGKARSRGSFSWQHEEIPPRVRTNVGYTPIGRSERTRGPI